MNGLIGRHVLFWTWRWEDNKNVKYDIKRGKFLGFHIVSNDADDKYGTAALIEYSMGEGDNGYVAMVDINNFRFVD